MKITVLLVCFAVGGTIDARLKRATGGEVIKIKDAPYFVSLKHGGRHVCSGALISTRHVLTAAHCVLDKFNIPMSSIEVVIGMDVHHRRNVGHKILNISAHGGFAPNRPGACNIAVITLSAHIVRNEKQHEIALPNAEPQWLRYATLVGYNIEESIHSRRGLRKLSVRTYPMGRTYTILDDYGPMIYGTMKKPQGIGSSDLGAALVYEERIIGIASVQPSRHGRACKFVNVLKFKTFIEKTMEMEPSPTRISSHPSVVDFDDIE